MSLIFRTVRPMRLSTISTPYFVTGLSAIGHHRGGTGTAEGGAFDSIDASFSKKSHFPE